MLVVNLHKNEGVLVGDPADDSSMIITINRLGSSRAVLGISGGRDRVTRTQHFMGGEVAAHIIRHWRSMHVPEHEIERWVRGDYHGQPRPF